MRILALYPFLPYPSTSGAALRGRSVLDILAKHHAVSLVSFVGRNDRPDELPAWDAYPHFVEPPLLVPRQADEPLSPGAVRLREFRPQPASGIPAWLRFFDTAAMWNRIAALDLSHYDAVHSRYISMAPFALAIKRAAPHLRTVLDLDDIPSVFLRRSLRYPSAAGAWRRLPSQLKEAFVMTAYEFTSLREFDSVWVCSHIDFDRLSRRVGAARTRIVENIVDVGKLSAIEHRRSELALLMLGDFSYAPNKEGASYYVDKVWPSVRAALPDAQLWLVGANPDAEMLSWNGRDGILVTGRVPEITPYLASATASIAPLFAGSGTRLKILEAFASRIPVLTTTLGAEGIEAQAGRDLLIADSPADFIRYSCALLSTPSLCARIANSALKLVRAKYDTPVMSRSVLDCYSAFSK